MNKNWFEELDKSIEVGKKKWEKIEQLAKKLKEEDIKDTQSELLLLLIEHLRPLHSYGGASSDDLKKLTSVISNLTK